MSLTPRERAILRLLLTYPKRIFSKQEIYEGAWQEAYFGDDKTLSVHISNLRKKLKAVSGKDWIETIWGLGFRL
ncbi:winged helix-turn-helix domain-containing protein [Aerococcus mictus]|uniref:winged helix-turn-helix domain-containing protein n=1 Tax=Aerococcus mictus TaxID=2976810 RepID=UPI0028E8E1DD|nr:winged helix-turn-helix domain-containing protein [Aerococcus mictus]